MEAMVLTGAGRPLAPTRLPDPRPGEGQVLVRVAACAVCRTDLHIVDGELDKPKLPLVLGHQIVGSVVEASERAGRFAPGQRVGVPWLGWTCGECRYCPSGRENLCDRARFTGYDIDGGYAELTVADERFCLSIPDGSTPSTADTPIDPTNFQTSYLHGTSFATANCLLHDGELYNGSPACKLYTLTCQVGTDPTQKGALCPASQERNEFFQEVFDGPSFTLPDIAGTDGLTFHQGVGFLEAKDQWGGGSCVFDSASSLGNHVVLVLVDPEGALDEATEVNNTLGLNFMLLAAPSPDLLVFRITTNPASPTRGDIVHIEAEVRNGGSAAVPVTKLEPGQKPPTAEVPNLREAAKLLKAV